MLPLARLWTWIGNLFIPLAIGWAVYVRGGLTEKPPPEGVLVSRAYWGLLVTLIVAAALMWTLAFYVQIAKRKNALLLVPPNTTFEDEAVRSRIISWATVCAFALAVSLALIVFGVRYGESQIHRWDDPLALQGDFLGSRTKAYALGCPKQPCFAIGQRIDGANSPIFGVNEYILYVSDGGLVVVVLLIVAGGVALIRANTYQPPPALFEF
ncbi:Phosphoglycerate kinase (plasmid) [Mesorhizobium loti]|nr:Phosphoglycerate kinase [Mesorhizobium loti]